MKHAATALLVLCALAPHADAARRALLIGINDYSASTLGPPIAMPPDRDWPDLKGAVNDAQALQHMLVLLYGFVENDIVTLTDQQATRQAILRNIHEQLLQPAARDDILFFYYAGHGSQVRNSLSDEPDGLDESIVPADSRTGARDIRDKELRPLFNAILDRGARLTILLDNCYSGSGARGLPTGAQPRGIKADLRDVADRTRYGPRPEDRGALVLAAAQDFDRAWETRDEQKGFHGVFSWALLRAMRDASGEESARDLFLRARARTRAETPFQEPVMAGNARARLAPFLGARAVRKRRGLVFVEKVQRDGTVALLGGWAHGLTIGSELRTGTARLRVTALVGLDRSHARVLSGRAAIRSGTMLEVAGWAAPARPLRVWAPRVAEPPDAIATIARRLFEEASRRGIQWVRDPTESHATHLLRRGNAGWELLGSRVELLAAQPRDAIAAIAKLPHGASLFVQLPAPANVEISREGVEPTTRPDEADYILVGRYASGGVTYAWVRPATTAADRRKIGLPFRSDWIPAGEPGALRDAILRLRRIHDWTLLESPPVERPAYQLALRRVRDGAIAKDALIAGERYELALRHRPSAPARQRYVYVFTIDRFGKSTLLFPRCGSVENRIPIASPAPAEIRLGVQLEIVPPYGIDTYFLVTTDEPLADPWVLEFDGVRSRGGPVLTSASWSIERIVYESVPRPAPPKGKSPTNVRL
jgi:uncharacterized caspase-like protein